MVRATTGGVMKTYRSNLMNSFINMNASRNTVLTQRTFNSYAEDPAAAARAFRLRKSRMSVESQHTICTDAMKKYETAFSCLQANDDLLCTKEGVYGEYMKTLTGTTLSMLNDTTGDARVQLTKVLDQMSQMLVQTMNQKYGDNFIFAGADGHNVPFEIREDGKLYYRGVWVDASEPNVWKDGTGEDAKFIQVTVNDNGEVVYDPTAGDTGIYLKMDNATVLSKDEYEKLYTVPELQTLKDLKFETETDEDGNEVLTVFSKDGKEDPEGGYYKFTDINNKEHLISIKDYNIYQNSDFPIEYNEDGSVKDSNDPDQEGGSYMVKGVNSDGQFTLDPINISDYRETVARVNNSQLLKNADGTEYWKEDDEGTTAYCVVFNGKPETITKAQYDAEKLEADKLKYLADEKCFVDVGFGFQEGDNGKLIESSAFNSALNGINFLGYGLDADGDPKNLYSLVQKMKDIAAGVGDGSWGKDVYDDFYGLVQKFEAGVSNYQTEFSNLAASTTKLENQQELLEDNFYNLQEQYSDLEDVDMVDAITSFIWAEYCYNAALKVGNSILSESLMDYLN